MGFLSEVTTYWGNTTLVESDPGDEVHSSVIYSPFRADVYFPNDPLWGLYSREGEVLEAAAYYRGPEKTLVGQSQTTSLHPKELHFINEEFVYGGPVIPHFGHFLTATLPRLWYLRSSPKRRRRILCHGHETPDEWFSYTFIRDILWALGLTSEDFVRLENPSVIKRVWIPRPSMEEQNFIHRAFDDLARRVGRFHGVHLQPVSEAPIYLSKTRLTSGVTRFSNEHFLENYLSERGVMIVHPQEMSFPDQIRMLARAKVICGTVSSAMHSSLFVDRPSRIVALTGHNSINANYALIDRLKNNDAVYLYPEIEATGVSDKDGFLSTWTIDMEAAAKDIAAEIDRVISS